MKAVFNNIPPFEASGLLPPGAFLCDESFFHSHFVEGFPNSKTRRQLLKSFVDLRSQMKSLNIAATLWVGGSYVTAKLDPKDIDVVAFCDYEMFKGFRGEAKIFLEESFTEQGKNNRDVDWYIVPACSPDHKYYGTFAVQATYWSEVLGHWQGGLDRVRRQKGIVEMVVGDVRRAPSIPFPFKSQQKRKEMP